MTLCSGQRFALFGELTVLSDVVETGGVETAGVLGAGSTQRRYEATRWHVDSMKPIAKALFCWNGCCL